MFSRLSKSLSVVFLSAVTATSAIAKDVIHTEEVDQGLYSALLMSLLEPNARIDRFDIFNPPPPGNSIQAQKEWPAKAKAFQGEIWDRSMKYRKEGFEITTNGKIKAGNYDVKRQVYNFCLPQTIFLKNVDRSHRAKRKPGMVKVQLGKMGNHKICRGGKSKQAGYSVKNGVRVSVPLTAQEAEFVYNKAKKAKSLYSSVICGQPENFYDEIHCSLRSWQVYDKDTNELIVEGQWDSGNVWNVTVGEKPDTNWTLRSASYN